jgi:hypothetical protein
LQEADDDDAERAAGLSHASQGPQPR